MFDVTIRTNYQDHLRWVSLLEVKGEKLHRITQELALEFERALKEIVHQDTKRPTGATAASIESWPLSVTIDHVRYAVGSKSRGHVLRWLDRGRREVRPKRIRSARDPRFRAALRFVIEGQVFFRYYVRPSPPLFLMYRSAQMALSKMEEIVKRNIK